MYILGTYLKPHVSMIPLWYGNMFVIWSRRDLANLGYRTVLFTFLFSALIPFLVQYSHLWTVISLEQSFLGMKLGYHFISILYDNTSALLLVQVALLNGITMGGGAGVSVPGTFRVATDKTVWNW